MGEQQSSIDRLPEDILERLQELLRDPRVTQCETTRRINAILAAQSESGQLPEDAPERLSKSAINRYKLRMDKVGNRMKESREMAQMWIAKLGAAPQGKVGLLVNEILRTLSFDMALVLQEGKIDADSAPAVVDMLKGLALTMQRLEKASSENVKREEEIRKKALAEAADIAGTTAKLAGISDETIKVIRRDVLRMAE